MVGNESGYRTRYAENGRTLAFFCLGYGGDMQNMQLSFLFFLFYDLVPKIDRLGSKALIVSIYHFILCTEIPWLSYMLFFLHR